MVAAKSGGMVRVIDWPSSIDPRSDTKLVDEVLDISKPTSDSRQPAPRLNG